MNPEQEEFLKNFRKITGGGQNSSSGDIIPIINSPSPIPSVSKPIDKTAKAYVTIKNLVESKVVEVTTLDQFFKMVEELEKNL